MIQKTYVILAHKAPQQLKKLIDRLNDENSAFFIHIDKKSDIQPFTEIIKGENIHFLPEKDRINCLWGDFSQIIATINLMRAAVKSGRKGVVVQLTGQDYPIRSNRAIDDFLEKNADLNFIDSIPVEENWAETYRDKTESYKFNLSAGRGHCVTFRKVSKASVKALLNGTITMSQFLLLFKKRKLKLGLRQYGGSAWWTLNMETLRKMYDYITGNYSVLYKYYQYTTCPDEIFFQTIAKYLSETDSSVKLFPTITYVNWTRDLQAASPVVFTLNDLPELKEKSQQFLFARKFDADLDSEVFDELDKMNLTQKK
ncbi:glycosyl transferase [Bacteroidia bacterium]|nr:glycosyl transferase [Bacteroidia bacterium]